MVVERTSRSPIFICLEYNQVYNSVTLADSRQRHFVIQSLPHAVSSVSFVTTEIAVEQRHILRDGSVSHPREKGIGLKRNRIA